MNDEEISEEETKIDLNEENQDIFDKIFLLKKFEKEKKIHIHIECRFQNQKKKKKKKINGE